MQETNSSGIRSWADRCDALDIRQGSGAGGTPSEPIVNGMSVEYMVQLANDLNANPWFNMPHMADDDFVRNFATYVRDHLKPGLTAYVEWSNEIWNFGWGTANGTATAGRDYVAAAGSVTFSPGQTRRTITVIVIGDRIAEADETFRVGLASPLNATLSATASRGTGTIRNDDGPIRRAAVFASLAAVPFVPTATKARR